jgi:diadenosine tetraphosphatase ApaH/serine/threonine PP2A family protein phosphatase
LGRDVILAAVRILLLSDIHANFQALQAVLNDATARGFDRVVCLGDAVGYGPNPVEVLETLESLGANCIVGNHDEWLLSIWHGEDPQHYGVIGMVLRWQLNQLGPRHISQLRTWVGKRNISTGGEEGVPTARGIAGDRIPKEFLIIHGSPRSTFEYVDSISVARTVFGVWPGRLAFVGHTHIPGVYTTLDGPAGDWTRHHTMPDEHNRLVLPPKARWIANPGSVGQPRDGDPRSSYGFYDDERGIFEVHRVAYDIEIVQRQLREAGLPEPIAARLSVGR